MTLGTFVLVALAGGVGALARYSLHSVPRRDGRPLDPAWRILAINVVASFLAGVAFVTAPEAWQPVVVGGFCGGLSTWSTFMTDAARFWRVGRRGAALALIAGHAGYGIAAAVLGFVLGSAIR